MDKQKLSGIQFKTLFHIDDDDGVRGATITAHKNNENVGSLWVGEEASIDHPDAGYDFPKEPGWRINHDISVDPKFRKQGIGRELWKQAEKAFPSNKFSHGADQSPLTPEGYQLVKRVMAANPDRHILANIDDVYEDEVDE